MRVNRFRLLEPDVGDRQRLAPQDLDLMLAPLTMFDAARNRVGMGGGYYDCIEAEVRDVRRDRIETGAVVYQ